VYFAAGLFVTMVGLGAIALSGTPWEARLIRVAVGLVVLWFLYLFYVLRQIKIVGDEPFAPLGLRLASMPGLVESLFHDIRTMEGAVSYVGRRRGRDVAIVIGAGETSTVVSGPSDTTRPPKTPNQMGSLTGLPPSCWRGVTVRISDGSVIVQRTGRGSGRWFLHDLLLAESVAGSPATAGPTSRGAPNGSPAGPARNS
jgi:hypothetical protein